MPARKPHSRVALDSAVSAVLAVFAVVAAISFRRYTARARVQKLRGNGGLNAVDVRRWSTDQLHSLDDDRFQRLCTAYYESRQFRLASPRPGGRGRDADLFFGTLSYPVAIVRSIASGADAVEVDAIRDLVDTMSQRRVVKGIVHATGGYTDAALAYARGYHIRLVAGEAFLRSIAGMPQAARLALWSTMNPRGLAPRPQREAVPH